MTEHCINRRALVMGNSCLGAGSYQFHARADDLEQLAKALLENVQLYRRGETPWHALAEKRCVPVRAGEPVFLFSEYITLSGKRTDRTTVSFYAVDSLAAHHVMKSTAATLGIGLARFLWPVVLPGVGAIATLQALVRAL